MFSELDKNKKLTNSPKSDLDQSMNNLNVKRKIRFENKENQSEHDILNQSQDLLKEIDQVLSQKSDKSSITSRNQYKYADF